MVASALMNAKMFLPGVRRPGIAAIFPSHRGPIVIIDVGANMNAKAEDLYQYGIMGSIYAENVLGIADPKIGLMNVGSEDDKGNELTKTTRALFKNGPHAERFVGNVEGRDIYEGHARVIVCEGFVGNVLLKAGEGAVEFLFSALKQELGKLLPELGPEAAHKLAASFKELKTRFEYQEFGGGPLLGLRGACIICHGSSGARAIRNALRVAGTMAEERVNAQFVAQLREALDELPDGLSVGYDRGPARYRPLPNPRRPEPMPKIAFLFPGQGPRSSAWAGGSTTRSPPPGPCSTGPTRSSGSTSRPSASTARPRPWRRPTSASRPSTSPAWRPWRA